MSLSEMRAVRKVCFTGPFLQPLTRRTDTSGTAPLEPFSLPAAVILLNSPSNTARDFEEYLALWELAGRQSELTSDAHQVHPCTFICGDGAYSALLRYSESIGTVDTTAALCDALIGDMDSMDSQTWARAAGADVVMPAMPTSYKDEAVCHWEKKQADPATAAAAVMPTVVRQLLDDTQSPLHALFSFDGRRYETVDDIPDVLIERLHRRVRNRRSETASVMPVACQMTTDFHKCILLLQRLQHAHPDDVVCYTTAARDQGGLDTNGGGATPHTDAASADARALIAVADRLCSASAARYSEEFTDTREADRCLSLLAECTGSASPSDASSPPMDSVVLPTVLVLGALGGRLDHELSAFNALSLFARELNVVLLNAQNIVLVCWPDGVTQWLPWRVPLAADAAPPRRSMCGIVPLGPVAEMETTGLLYNIVNGRSPPRYDGFTQNSQYHFGFDGIIASCNEVTQNVVTVDMRPLNPAHEPIRAHHRLTAEAAARASADPLTLLFNRNTKTVNPPTIITCQRDTVA